MKAFKRLTLLIFIGLVAFLSIQPATAQVPLVTSVSPGIGNRNATNLNVVIHGSNFQPGAVASFDITGPGISGITVNSTVFNSSTQLTLSIDIAPNANIGSRHATVTNPGGASYTGTNLFSVISEPTITGATPVGNEGANSLDVIIGGTGFLPGAAVLFTGVPAITVNQVTYVSDSELIANIDIPAGAAGVTYNVQVTNPGSVSIASTYGPVIGALSVDLLYIAEMGAPDLAAIVLPPPLPSPLPIIVGQSLNRGAQNVDLIVKGQNFLPGATANFTGAGGIVVNSVTFVNPTELKVNVSVLSSAMESDYDGDGLVGDADPVDDYASNRQRLPDRAIKIANPGGASATSSLAGFSFVIPAGTDILVDLPGPIPPTVVFTTQRNIPLRLPGVGLAILPEPTFVSITPNSGNQGAVAQWQTWRGTNFTYPLSMFVETPDGTHTVDAAVTMRPIFTPWNAFTLFGMEENFTEKKIAGDVSIDPTAVPGARTAKLLMPGGVTVYLTNGYTVLSSPTVASVSPSAANRGTAGLQVAIYGTNFVPKTEISTDLDINFGPGITVVPGSTAFISSSEITATIDIDGGATTGPRDVTVTNPGNVSTAGLGVFTVLSSVTISKVTPDKGTRGARGLDIVIEGANFIDGATVSFDFPALGGGANGITVNFVSVVSQTQIDVNVDIATVAAPGVPGNIIVTNPGGSNASGAFEVVEKPTILSISLSVGNQGATNLSLTITGADFLEGATVIFTPATGIAVNAVNVVSNTNIWVDIDIDQNAPLTQRSVTVTNPGGASVTLPGAFTVIGALTVASATPSAGNQGAIGLTIGIIGANFTPDATVEFTDKTPSSGTGITVASTTFVNPGRLNVVVNIDPTAQLGARDVTVTSSGGLLATGSSIFTVLNDLSVTAVNPPGGNVGALLTGVVITGTGFVNAPTTNVSFNSAEITVSNIVVNSDTQITCDVEIDPAAALGQRNVTVTNPGSVSATGFGLFNVLGAPTILSVTPSVGAPTETLNIVILGTNFVPSANATFDSWEGIVVNSTTFNNDSQLTVNITVEPTAFPGARNVKVTNPGGAKATALNAFTVLDSLSVTLIGVGAPAAPPALVEQGITYSSPLNPLAIGGTGFVNGAVVSFSGTGVNVVSVSFVNDTLLEVNVTIDSTAIPGLRDLTVTNPNGLLATLPNALNILPPPTVLSVSPDAGNTNFTGIPGDGTGHTALPVVIKGANFTLGSTVSVSGGVVVVGPTVVVDATTISTSFDLDTTPAVVGPVSITVTPASGATPGVGVGIFEVLEPVALTGATPALGNQGATGLDVTINGANFIEGATVDLGAATISTNLVTFVSRNQLIASISIMALTPVGLYDITVTNPAGAPPPAARDTVATDASAFQVLAAPPTTPVLLSITSVGGTPAGSPPPPYAAVAQGATNVDVTIEADKPFFVNGAAASFGGTGISVNATNYLDTTHIIANIDVSQNAPLDTQALGRSLTVENPGGIILTKPGADADSLRVVNSPPVVLAASPSAGNQGAITLNVEIIGANFKPSSTLNFSGAGITVNSVTFNNSTSLTANIDIDPTATLGLRTVSVTNPDPILAQTGNGDVLQVYAPPAVLTVNPNTGTPNTTLDVDITGASFIPGATVTLSGVGISVVNPVTFNNSGHLSANITIDPSAPTTTRDVVVTCPGGVAATGPGLFTVTSGPPPPTVPVLTLSADGFLVSRASSEDSGGNSTISATVGSTITLHAMLDTDGQSVDGVSMYLTYDDTMLQVITGNGQVGFPPQYPTQTFMQPFRQSPFIGGVVLENDDHDEPNSIPGGQADYTEGNTSTGVTGKGEVAYIQFVVIAPGTTTICFDFDPGNLRDTRVSIEGGGTYNPTTSCATIVATAAPSPVATGHVLLDGRTDHSSTVTLEIRNPGEREPLETQVINTTSDGSFMLTTALPSGVYDVTAKTNGFLRSIAANVPIPSGAPIVFSPSPLLGGDCDDNNAVNLVDFSILANAFGATLEDPLFNPACDFDGDGAISLADFSILVANFAQMGAPPVGPLPAPSAFSDKTRRLAAYGSSTGVNFNLEFKKSVDSLEVAVMVSNAKNLHGYSFTLNYDKEMLQSLESIDGVAQEGSFLKASGATLFAATERTTGNVLVINSLRTRKSASSSTNGQLAIFKFKVKREGSIANALALTNISTIDHTGKPGTGEWLPVTGKLLQDIRLLPMSFPNHQSPHITKLAQNYPNPFNPETWIPFELAKDADVTIRIFDAKGQLVRALNLGRRDTGYYIDKSTAIHWDGKNELGEKVASGIYFYQLQAGDFFSQTRKMLIVK